MKVSDLLKGMLEVGASDLHITAGTASDASGRRSETY